MSTVGAMDRIFNFSSGPATLPLPVLQQVQRELLSLPDYGASMLEISHRSAKVLEIMEAAKERLRQLLSIPASYRILFLQGGARLQFSMVPMNLLRGTRRPADYLLTGTWGVNAMKEARLEGAVRTAWDGKSFDYDRVPTPGELDLDAGAPYLHLTSNETIQGVQFPGDPEWATAPVVCDASSDLLSRSIDVEQYGLIYACAQKNAGPAGVTVVIIRDDLVERSGESLPGYLSYRVHAEARSRWNTPPTFGIYIVGLVAKWLLEEIGGLTAMERRNREKARLLYDAIDESGGFYRGHAQPQSRSLMNVAFRLPNERLEREFIRQASAHELEGLKGHRALGGIRASIYNAMPIEGVKALRDFMVEFRDRRVE